MGSSSTFRAIGCKDAAHGLVKCADLQKDAAHLSRVGAKPAIFGGKPIIRGMRISVELILSLLAQGASVDEILDDYPELDADDIRACLIRGAR